MKRYPHQTKEYPVFDITTRSQPCLNLHGNIFTEILRSFHNYSGTSATRRFSSFEYVLSFGDDGIHCFLKKSKNDSFFEACGAISIGTWFLCVIAIVQGGCNQGSPSICIGKRLRVRITTLEHWASLRPA